MLIEHNPCFLQKTSSRVNSLMVKIEAHSWGQSKCSGKAKDNPTIIYFPLLYRVDIVRWRLWLWHTKKVDLIQTPRRPIHLQKSTHSWNMLIQRQVFRLVYHQNNQCIF